MKMDSLDSLTYGGVRGRENLFNFPSYSIALLSVAILAVFDKIQANLQFK